MDPKTLSNSKRLHPNYMIYTIFTLIANSTNPALSLNTKFDACAPANCGNGPNISYPFWLSSVQDPFCGYQDFEITCSDESEPVLTISEDDYRIKDIYYTNQSIFVANAPAAYDQSCPALDVHNISLYRTPFRILPGYVNLSLFYNCSTNPSSLYYMYPIDCLTNSSSVSYASLHKEFYQVHDSSFVESCQGFVDAPVITSGGVVSMNSLMSMKYTEVLDLGFVLNWTAQNCSTCELSGGRCGFENQTLVCFCHDKSHPVSCHDGKRSDARMKAIIGVIVLIGSLVILSIITFCLYKIFVKCKFNKENDEDIETFISNHGALAMKRYRYKEIKKITNSFSEKLGEGGFGSVYKGKLSDGRVVAVKVLKLSKGNGGEFLNEVTSISRTSHVNVVTLLGYCFESNKRVLIFEFMSNGSLDKFIRNRASCAGTGMVLAWQTLYQIAVGVARGLEYLHRGCNTRIVHFDIKPHNILLDDDFRSKISDFGLAKLSNARENIMSSMMEARGTIGYIAPEVFNRNFGNVSSKSDVYSYGMLLLDIIGARQRDHTKVDDADGTGSSLCYFPNGIYKQVELEKYDLYGSLTVEEVAIIKRMTLIGLWCIQTIPSSRPAMSKVIEMLEGSMEALETPPKPFLFSPPRLPVSFSTASTTETGWS